MWIFSLIVAQIGDMAVRRKSSTLNIVRKTANTIGNYKYITWNCKVQDLRVSIKRFPAHVGPAICLIVVSYIGCQKMWTLVLLTLAVSLQGAIYSGYYINHLDLSPNFAGTIYGLISGIASINSWLAPLTVATLTEGEVWFNPYSSQCFKIFIKNTFLLFNYSKPWPSGKLPSCWQRALWYLTIQFLLCLDQLKNSHGITLTVMVIRRKLGHLWRLKKLGPRFVNLFL